MLVLAGVGATHWFDRGGIEEAYRDGPEDYVGAMRPICKKAVMATRPDTAIDMFLRAYKTALFGPSRPRRHGYPVRHPARADPRGQPARPDAPT